MRRWESFDSSNSTPGNLPEGNDPKGKIHWLKTIILIHIIYGQLLAKIGANKNIYQTIV